MAQDDTILDNAHDWRKATDSQIKDLRTDVGDLKTGLGEVKAGQKYLADTVNSAVMAFQQAAKPKDTQWGILISLLGLIVVIAGGFTTLTTSPITKVQEQNMVRIQQLEDTDALFAKFTGKSETWRDKTQVELGRLWTHVQEFESQHLKTVELAAYARGKQDASEGRLDRLTQRLEKLGERTYNAKP